MATTWGGTSIPDPTTWDWEDVYIGAQYRVADGTIKADTLATKQRITVRWENITKAERDTIHTKFVATSAATLSLSGIDSYSVLGIWSSWRATPVGGASALWNVSCTVEV